MKEACAYDCNMEPTPISVQNQGSSRLIEELIPLTLCGVMSKGLQSSPMPLLERQDIKWVSVIPQGVEGGWKKALSVPSTASGSSPVSCDRVCISIPETDPRDRADSKMNDSQLYQLHSGLHPTRLCVDDPEEHNPSVNGFNSDWLPSKIK